MSRVLYLEDSHYAATPEMANRALAKRLLGPDRVDRLWAGFRRHQPLPCFDLVKAADMAALYHR